MPTFIWWCLFALLVMTALLLPLLPALREWRWPTDTRALQVTRGHDGSIRSFAQRFRQVIDSELPALIGDTRAHDVVHSGVSQAGEPYVIVGENQALASVVDLGATHFRLMVIALGDLQVPETLICEFELYAGRRAALARGCAVRALLARGDVSIALGAQVMRWVHTDGDLTVAAGARLCGRASADKSMHLSKEVRFDRLNAPVIYFGVPKHEPEFIHANLAVFRVDGVLLNERFSSALVMGNLSVPAGRCIEGDLVVRGNLDIGDGCHIKGSVKVGKRLRLGAHVRIDGALVCAGHAIVASGCRIVGPLITERRLVVAENVTVGGADQPTTVTADRIRIAEGCVVWGTVWARAGGAVMTGGAASA